MALISKTTIQEVNNRLDAVSLVNDYISLEKKSGRYWAKCPFHAGGQEKTPSFTVDPDIKTYYCFGCNKGGSVIGFIMEMDSLSYPEAIKFLAKKLGIEIIYEDGGEEQTTQEKYNNLHREQLFELYRRTTITFQHFLREKTEGQNAKNYLLNRGFNNEMIERFNIGYSPANKDFLHKFLISKGYSKDFLEKSGLFLSQYKTFPLFSGRLMFPIADRSSKIMAFGGRALPGNLQNDGSEAPKYINSPETEIYKKGQTLYALDLAIPEIRKQKTAYLGEGYLDVIALHQAGITNTVASLGTSFTKEQADLLRRWADKIILVFDNDEAGKKAAYKSIITARTSGLSCALVNTKAGLEALKDEIFEADSEKFKDPADILHKFGPKILNKIVNCTINDFEYLIGRGRYLFKTLDGSKSKAAEFMFPFLEVLNSEVEREDCIALIADAFMLNRNSVKEDFLKRKTPYTTRRQTEKTEEAVVRHIRMNAEIRLLTLVAVNMSLYPQFRSAVEIKEVDDPVAKELFIAMEECYIHDEADIDSLLSRVEDVALKNFIGAKGSSAEFKSEAQRQMEDGINKVVAKKRLDKRLIEIGAQIRECERTGNTANIDELLAEKKVLDSQTRKITGR